MVLQEKKKKGKKSSKAGSGKGEGGEETSTATVREKHDGLRKRAVHAAPRVEEVEDE